MKTFLTAISTLVVGAAAGAFCMRVYDAKELFTQSLAAIQETGKQDTVQVMVSLNLLEVLEEGKIDTVKSFLAGRVASYYRAFHDFQPMSEETRKLMDQIQAASEKSPSLKEALNAPSK
jgi:NAD-specific glutamate dehydrogenase